MRAVRMRLLCKMFDNMIAVYAMLINLSMISVLLLACELAHVGALARIEARARAATSRDTRLLDRFALRRFLRVTQGWSSSQAMLLHNQVLSISDISLVPNLVLAAKLAKCIGNGRNLTQSPQPNFQNLLSCNRQKPKIRLSAGSQATKLATNWIFICKLMQNRRLQTHLQCKPIKSGLCVPLSIWFDPHD